MNMKITRLALGVKCGFLGASGLSSAANISDSSPGKMSPPPASDRITLRRLVCMVVPLNLVHK